MQAIDSAPNGDSKFKVNLGTVQIVQIVQAVQPLRSIHHGDEPVPDVPIVQPLRSVQIVNGRPVLPIERCLGRLCEPFIHFFLEGEQRLDARTLRAILLSLRLGDHAL